MKYTEMMSVRELVEDYVDEANEHEDEPLTEKEVNRLMDFVVYYEEMEKTEVGK